MIEYVGTADGGRHLGLFCEPVEEPSPSRESHFLLRPSHNEETSSRGFDRSLNANARVHGSVRAQRGTGA